MSAKYVFRIDDVVPGMNWGNFEKIEKIFDKYGVKPIIGVVPDNKDSKIGNNNYAIDFWNKINKLKNKGRIIAQHGFNHKYVNNNGGLLKINKRGEFSGLEYEEQYEMIKKGKHILEDNLDIKIKRRMAPAHSFDRTTCKVLEKLGFEYITDGLALYPFSKYGLKWLPQQIWKPINKKFGVRTICLHINGYNSKFIDSIDVFLKNNNKFIVSPENLYYESNYRKNIISLIFKIKFHVVNYLYNKFINLKNYIEW